MDTANHVGSQRRTRHRWSSSLSRFGSPLPNSINDVQESRLETNSTDAARVRHSHLSTAQARGVRPLHVTESEPLDPIAPSPGSPRVLTLSEQLQSLEFSNGAMHQHHQSEVCEPAIWQGMTRSDLRHRGLVVATDCEPPCARDSVDSPATPTNYVLSDMESQDGEYNTPMTSPSSSPVKPRLSPRKLPIYGAWLDQLDGRDDTGLEFPDPATRGIVIDGEDEEAIESDDDISEGSHRARVDLTQPRLGDESSPECISTEDDTPFTKASNSEGLFPFSTTPSDRPERSLLASQRLPSALLQYCERNATPRQRRLMAGALQTPDRFIPARANTPTKEALQLRKPPARLSNAQRQVRTDRALADPFRGSPSRGARMAERYATIRRLPSGEPTAMRGLTIVPDGRPTDRRVVSAGAVWTVGSTAVTEGVASTTNGRGGRVTSGTTAPHHSADFLRRQSPSEEEVQHGQRLAIAMGVNQTARMFENISPSPPRIAGSSNGRRSCSDTGRRQTYWNNNRWEQAVMTTPTKAPKSKLKDIPVIPFRVLDAPALRDDYYCSLLAYSPSMQCLAVGLGSHVYLWSESRGTTPNHIPDSLKAPFGAHVTSVSFSSVEGGSAILAIGWADGRITLWSPKDPDPRFNSEQPAAVSCVCFRPNVVKRRSIREPTTTVATEELLVGDEVGNVYYYSIEWPNPEQRDLFDWQGSMTLLARVSCHTQQVCGIAWSKAGEYFATGGNDNYMYVFESKKLFARSRDYAGQIASVNVSNGRSSGNAAVAGQGGVLAITPGQQKQLFKLNAAVKAIAFAPWQPSLVAAGGGSNDRCIHFYHVLSGAALATIDCHAQITSLVWSEKRKEIAATFGFAQPEHPYRVAVFSWPSCRRAVGIPWWGEERALYAVAYPGGPSGPPASESRRTGPRRRRGTHRGAGIDAEGRSWYGKRTTDEGCLVIATSDASIKFHEIWPERSEQGRGGMGATGGGAGTLGGSLILEDAISAEVERSATIR